MVYGLPAPEADLQVKLTSCGTPVRAGAAFDYGIQLVNAGPDAAEAVRVDLVLDADLTLIESFPGGACSQGAGNVECSFGSPNPGQSTAFGINVQSAANTTGPVVSSAAASSATLDPSAGNNISVSTDAVSADVVFAYGGERCRPAPDPE